MNYNPSAAGKKGSIFGLPHSLNDSKLILLPVHLDVTVSYKDGTSCAPDIILEESSQIDLSLIAVREPWKMPMAIADRIIEGKRNQEFREQAASVIARLESGLSPDPEELHRVNAFCEACEKTVYQSAKEILNQGKWVGIIGGDHSAPLGAIRALSETHHFGILQIDAHMDLRNSYEGFRYSHASIMHNALKEDQVLSLTQVGIRDFCEEEEAFVDHSSKPIHVFYDEKIYREQLTGNSWALQVKEIIQTLPESVYVSFDLDGLEPSLCPHTGTPVPGGLSFHQAAYLLEELVRSGRKIIGFDVCECGNHLWDANVASRILFRLSTLTGISQGLLRFR